MTGDAIAERCDLLVVTDATGSMDSYLTALARSLPQIVGMSLLTGAFERIGVLAYRDYSDDDIIEWSGWYDPQGNDKDDKDNEQTNISRDELLRFVNALHPEGGGDWPEAAKTGLAKAYQVMRPSARTIIIFFADAPPHFVRTRGPNYEREHEALGSGSSYGKHSSLFADWAQACSTFATGGPEGKRASVFSFIGDQNVESYSPFHYLSALTGGACFVVATSDSTYISHLTVGTLLAWMGAEKAGRSAPSDSNYRVCLLRYKNTEHVQPFDKESQLTQVVLCGRNNRNRTTVCQNISSKAVTADNLASVLPIGRTGNFLDFSKRYMTEPSYRAVVQRELRSVISSDIDALTINPIFGSLWRTVAADRKDPVRIELLNMFSKQIGKVSDQEKQKRLSAWLAESYNYAAEIAEDIAAVPTDRQFPCVILDPTHDFTVDMVSEEEDNRPINQFTRDELLEIGRSCDSRVLGRLGKVLTRLTYVERAEDLPAHLAKANVEKVPRLPLAMADKKHHNRFWRLLLHLVLPGTMLGPRPAILLAALTLRIGLRPLRDIADDTLIRKRKTWNTLDVPETWNTGCLLLLLDADADYERRIASGETQRSGYADSILLPEDRRLFRALVDYKILERNLHTTLVARIGWTPEKTPCPIGPLVICRKCRYPRSVTTMSKKNICGLCDVHHANSCGGVCALGDDQEERTHNNVSANDTATTTATWVECNVRTCRAQYVVYNPDKLHVRPKCFNCRHGLEGDWVECSTCDNRMVFPYEYRPKRHDNTTWQCPPCTGNVLTIVEANTDADALRNENGNSWLVSNEKVFNGTLFNGRSMFHTASTIDRGRFSTNLSLMPDTPPLKLTLKGKRVHNVPAVRESLQGWVRSHRVEQGTCSLCIGNFRKDALVRACGRKGCEQLICAPCRKQWYGLNGVGRVINVAALQCPFCRRLPVASAVSEFGLPRLGDLRRAVEEEGSWIYAWCNDCGFARPFVERECARGAPRVTAWMCDPCQEVLDTLVETAAADDERRDNELQRSRAPKCKPERSKRCPGCGAPTVKAGGCDHITCPCGTHWCWACGSKESEDNIYEHINDQHGGLWGDDEDWE